MKYIDESSIWGDNWQIDGNNAWFVMGMGNILCCIDLQKYEGELVASIPDVALTKFRRNSFCMKYQNDIYCMPVYADSIWVYDTINHRFQDIQIDNVDGVPINIRGGFWEYERKIYAVSNGLRQIVEIDPVRKKIDRYYPFCKGEDLIKSMRVGDLLFGLSGTSKEIYQFSLNTKKVIEYKIPDVGRGVNTICFDGENFWMSGWRKEVYVWDRKENRIKIIDGFPETFGIYSFSENTDGVADCETEEYDSATFLYAIAVGEIVWFIPYMTNKIIFVDTKTCVLREFDIEEEKETRESILARNDLLYKYVLEYVKDNRYIGLYSIKNKCMLEIDTVALKYEYKRYDFYIGKDLVRQYAEIFNSTFYEGNILSDKIFMKLLYSDKQDKSVGENMGLGAYIYRKTVAYEQT